MPNVIYLTKSQARKFLLAKQGLSGPKRYQGEEGILAYIRSVGSLQFDPVDVCGKNSEIILQSRVADFTKDSLNNLLYTKRQLIDFFDKNLCIFPIEDWPYLAPYFIKNHPDYVYQSPSEIEQMKPIIRRLIKKQGHISASQVEDDKRTIWHWSVATSLARATLETMYFAGELIIHHKTGTIKSYAFAKDHLPTEISKVKKAFKNEEQRHRWLVERRIKAIGMLWNKASDAWLGTKLNTSQRNAAFSSLLKDNSIFAVEVEGINETLYISESDRPLLQEVLANKKSPERTELIAPFDCLLWDRKLIAAIFDFFYKWEIYTPVNKRKYGPYTLPILQGERFIGRIDVQRQKPRLIVNEFYPEDHFVFTEKNRRAINNCLKRFAVFNDCLEVSGSL